MTEFMICGRGGGKTFEAVHYVKTIEGGVLLVATSEMKRRVMIDYELQDDQVCTVGGREWLRGRRPCTVVIDNLDLILTQLVGANVGMVTLTAIPQRSMFLTMT